jgi:hypothetical protein
VLEVHGESYSPFALYHEISRGRPGIEITFQYLLKKPPFDNPARRLEWLHHINKIPGILLPDSAIDRRPNFPLLSLESEEAMTQFLTALDWFVGEVRKGTDIV